MSDHSLNPVQGLLLERLAETASKLGELSGSLHHAGEYAEAATAFRTLLKLLIDSMELDPGVGLALEHYDGIIDPLARIYEDQKAKPGGAAAAVSEAIIEIKRRRKVP